MTTIAAIRDKRTHKIWLGADTNANGADGNNTVATKLITVDDRMSGKMLCGLAGSVRTTTHLLTYPFFTEVDLSDSDLNIITNTFRKALTQHYTSAASGKTTSADNILCADNILIGWRGNIYEVYACKYRSRWLRRITYAIEVMQRRDYQAIGSGNAFALGALQCLHKAKMTPRAILQRALEAASAHDGFTRPPFTFACV